MSTTRLLRAGARRAPRLCAIEMLENRRLLSADLVFAHGFGSDLADNGNAIATDCRGNIYVTGDFSGTVDFDPGSGVTELTAAGGADIFVAKYSPDGDLIWAQNFGGSSVDSGFDIAVDQCGNVYVTGIFSDTVDFDPGAGSAELTSAGLDDAFILKLDKYGGFVWAQRFGGEFADTGQGIAVDPPGNVYVVGLFFDTATVDGCSLTSQGNTDGYVLRFSRNGNLVWAKSFGGPDQDVANDVAVRPNGDLYIGGFFSGKADLKPGCGTCCFTSAGMEDAFIIKMNRRHGFEWARTFGGPGGDILSALTVTSRGDVYSTGVFRDTVDFNPGCGVYQLTSNGGGDVFVNVLDKMGRFEWARSFGGPDNDFGLGIDVDACQLVYVTGSFAETVDFDPGPGVYELTAAGRDDVFVEVLNRHGCFVNAVAMGGPDLDFGADIAVGKDCSAAIVGVFNDTADFDPGAGEHLLTSNGTNDIFVAKLQFPCCCNLGKYDSYDDWCDDWDDNDRDA